VNDAFLFIWGLLALTLAVGPLVIAAILDLREDRK
jgi:hypothetical protein